MSNERNKSYKEMVIKHYPKAVSVKDNEMFKILSKERTGKRVLGSGLSAWSAWKEAAYGPLPKKIVPKVTPTTEVKVQKVASKPQSVTQVPDRGFEIERERINKKLQQTNSFQRELPLKTPTRSVDKVAEPTVQTPIKSHKPKSLYSSGILHLIGVIALICLAFWLY